jgi:hypothetical protein
LATVTAAACSGQQSTGAVYGYQALTTTGGPSGADVDAALELRQAAKKTLAAKVLAAIALERVTGRKPDPARFVGYN